MYRTSPKRTTPTPWGWRRRRTLVDMLRNDIHRTDDLAPAVRLADRLYPIIHSSLN